MINIHFYQIMVFARLGLKLTIYFYNPKVVDKK